jgi:magnesium-transporting ATPase (P-type)
MTNSEKWAWWTLGVIALSLIVFFALVAILRNVPASQSAFALLSLAAIPAIRRQRKLSDERDREISGKALLAAFRAIWVAFIGLVMTVGFVKGWDSTLSLPVWLLCATTWWGTVLVLTVEAATTLVLYRRG